MAASSVVVIGAGLAGAACADAFAAKGYAVTVISAQAGASQGLPVGLLCAHVSWPDIELSQLSRAGLELTLSHLTELLPEGQDWQKIFLTQRLLHDTPKNQRMRQVTEQLPLWYRLNGNDLVHLRAAWVKPKALCQAWLKRSEAKQIAQRVQSICWHEGYWQALSDSRRIIAQAEHIVIAAAQHSASLIASLGFELNMAEVHGQVACGAWPERFSLQWSDSRAINGNGHFIAPIPTGSLAFASTSFWLSGSTYVHPPLPTGAQAFAEGLQANHERLSDLLPGNIKQHLDLQFARQEVQTWQGVRCSRSDRLPLLRSLLPGLHVCTALGSRGLSFSAILAQRLVESLCAISPAERVR